MDTCTAENCGYFVTPDTDEFIPKLKANPDISGIGVLVGFMGTAYLTFILLLVYYLIYLHSQGFANSNPIDMAIAKRIQQLTHRDLDEKWIRAVQRCMLMLSDQQMVTGLAILVAGYSQLHCGLSSYHWQTIISLAWFSAFTHLTTLTVLRTVFRQRNALRFIRIAVVLLVAIMLAVALIPTGSGYWFNIMQDNGNVKGILVAGVPAACFFKELSKSNYPPAFDQGFSAAISLSLLFLGYLVRCVQLFDGSSDFVMRYLRKIPGKWWKEKVLRGKHPRMHTSVIYSIILNYPLGIYVFLKAVADLLESMLWEIFWLAFVVTWGTVRLISTRRSILGTDNEVVLDENFWAFGQIVPILLLGLPVLGITEVWYDTWLETNPGQSRSINSAPDISTETQIPLGSLPRNFDLGPNQAERVDDSNTTTSSIYNRDFYQYSWFCGVIILDIALILHTSIWFLYQLAASTSIESYLSLLWRLAFFLGVVPALGIVSAITVFLSFQDYPHLWLFNDNMRDEAAKIQKIYLKRFPWVLLIFIFTYVVVITWKLGVPSVTEDSHSNY